MRQLQEEHVREAGPEHGSVQHAAARSRLEDVVTARTVQLHVGLAQLIGQAHRQTVLALTKDPGTDAELAPLVLRAHGLNTRCGKDIAGMDQAIQALGVGSVHGLVPKLALEVWIKDGVQGQVEVRHRHLQARQIEPVVDVVVGHAQEEVMPLQAGVPADPAASWP